MSRQLFPRQSAASSESATASSSDVTTPGTASSSGSDTTAVSSPAPATGQTSPSPTSDAATSSTPASTPTVLTTSSGSTETPGRSASPPASSSQSSDNSPSTSSDAPTSASANTPPATSSTPSPSSSVSPPNTTQPPTSSSSQQEALTITTITSSYTTFIDGSQVVSQTTYPSTIPAASSNPTSSDRAAIIGGSAAAGTALLILVLSLAFCARRKRFKRLNFLNAITRKRNEIHSRATLLDGEILAQVDLQRPPQRYTDYETPWDARDSRDGSDRTLMAGRASPGTPPTLTRHSRWSESGSAFKEDVWPPPHEGTGLMDPIANRDDIDLSRIVDDVMGPSLTAVHYSDRSVSSVYRDSMAASDGVAHSRTVSNASNAALLEAAGLGGTVGAGVGSPLATAPVRSSPLALPGHTPSSAGHQSQDAP